MIISLMNTWAIMDKRRQALTVGRAVLAPFVYVLLTMPIFLIVSSANPYWQRSAPWWYYTLGIPIAIWYLLLLTMFFRHLRGNSRIEEEQRPLWRFLLIVGNFYSMAYYWYRFMWPELREP